MAKPKQVEQWDDDYTADYQSHMQEKYFPSGAREYNGYAETPEGTVTIQSGSWPKEHEYTRFDLVRGGRRYTRHINISYRPRYLVTLARRFAAEIAGKE